MFTVLSPNFLGASHVSAVPRVNSDVFTDSGDGSTTILYRNGQKLDVYGLCGRGIRGVFTVSEPTPLASLDPLPMKEGVGIG